MLYRINRRAFIKSSILGLTGLTIGCSTDSEDNGEDGHDAGVATGEETAIVPSIDMNIWVNIAEDNQITVFVAKNEMGQGITTALPMIVAEELEADWQMIKFESIPEIGPHVAGQGFGQGMTASSMSVRSLYDPLREAGAAAKALLIQAAANRWNVDSSSLSARNSQVLHPTEGTLSYGELALEAGELDVPLPLQLKDPKDYKIIGQPLDRLDAPDHLEGKTIYATDVVVPDMLYASLRLSPVFGGKVSNFDSLSLEGTNGEKIVPIENGVAVVAKSWWEAEKAAESLQIEYDNPEEMLGLNNETISRQLNDDLTTAGTSPLLVGQPIDALDAAPIKLENIVYEVPYLAHECMEPMTCTASVTPDSCEIWVPTQGAGLAINAASRAADIPIDKVKINVTSMGGGFGRKTNTDYVMQAVSISKAVGKPVNLIWPRSEDIQQDRYRPARATQFSGGIDEDGSVSSWIAKSTGAVTMFDADTKAAIRGPYDIPNASSDTARSGLHSIPTGAWRSVAASYNVFFVESFIDELAHAAGQDPLAFRKMHLGNMPRGVNVLDAVAAMSNWPNPSVEGAAQGVAFCSDVGSFIAQVVELSVDSEGKVTVHKVYSAIDCGRSINPDILKAQTEGSVVFGLSAALNGEVKIENGRTVQSNFHDSPILTMKDSPPVETQIIESGAAIGGIGELAVPPVFPAVTNAIYNATKQRLRKLPVRESATRQT